MTKTIKKGLSLILAVITIMSCLSAGLFASAVGKVATLKATAATQNSISLSWSKVSDADGYRLYKYDFSHKKWKTLKTTTAVSFTDKNLAEGSLNAYGVRAIEIVNGKYVYGEASPIIKVLTLPGATAGLKASKITDSSVTLSWNKAAGAQGYAVYSYNSASKKYVLIGAPSAASFTVNNLKASTSYKFAVRAYVKNGYVAYGKVAYITVKTIAVSALSKAANLRLEAYNAKAFRLRWDAVSGAEGYQLALYNTEKNKWESALVTKNTYAVITPKDPNGNYYYKVRAYKKTDSGYVFGALSDATYGFAKPATPTGLQGAENSDKGISLKWDSIPGVSGYQVYTYDAANGKWVALGATVKNTYNVTGLSQTSHYKYKVRALKQYNGKRYYGDFCESVTVNYHGTENDSIYSEEMEKSGVFGYLYDPANKCFYTADDPWQRNIGYNSIFDTAAPLTLINFDTTRLRFEYGDKDWMIQLWKGQYGLIFYGAEVGVYTKPKDRKLMHYDCATDSEMLKMSMVFNEKKGGEWKKQFTRPYGYYWWCTGFIPGNKLGNFDVLSVDMRITAKDYDMLQRIKDALTANNITFTANGLDVYFTY